MDNTATQIQLCLVIPCFNEAQRLKLDTFRIYLKENPTHRFLFIDDGSTDSTASILQKFCSEEKQAETLSLTHNFGKAEAVRKGVMTVLLAREAHPLFVGYWDADLSTPLSEISHFLDVLHKQLNIQLVTGARVHLLGKDIRRKTHRHYIGRIFATFASLVLGLPVYDTQCGAKIFRVNEHITALFQDPFLSKWIFDVELLARMQKLLPSAASAIYELPVNKWIDVEGSKLKAADFFTAIFDLGKILRWKRSS